MRFEDARRLADYEKRIDRLEKRCDSLAEMLRQLREDTKPRRTLRLKDETDG